MTIDQDTLSNEWLDRLVDGELGDAERKAVLARLDAEPDGWRRCALAFLEAQTWREVLRSPIVSKPVAIPTRRRWSYPIAILAASVATAFGLGFAAAGWSIRPDVETSSSSIVEHRATPLPKANETAPASESPVVTFFPTLVAFGSGQATLGQWLRGKDSSVPAHVKREWERQGYEVDDVKRVVSVELDDGQELAIPFEEVQLRYVGQTVN
jgi:hypothetical protein